MNYLEYYKISAQAIIIILLLFIALTVDSIHDSVDLFDFDKTEYCN